MRCSTIDSLDADFMGIDGVLAMEKIGIQECIL